MLTARQRYNEATKEWELFNRFTYGKIASRKQKWDNIKVIGYNTMNNLDRATNTKKENDNFERAGIIHRTVSAKAYDLLKDCKEPEEIFEGSYMTHEHWHVDQTRLEEVVIDELADKWPEQDDDEIVGMIHCHCGEFLNSKEYEKLRDRVREDYYEYKKEQMEQQKYERAHQPTWRP